MKYNDFTVFLPLCLFKELFPFTNCLYFSTPVLVFPCDRSHVMCLECFKSYGIVRLNDRMFIEDKDLGYSLPCPGQYLTKEIGGVRVMVFNNTFNNISVMSWRSVLLVEETKSTRRKPQTCRKSLTNFIT